MLCADRNADEIEHVARYPYLRDAAIFVGNRERRDRTDVRARAADHPRLDRPQLLLLRLRAAVRPAALADTERLRAQHGYRSDEKIAIAAVGGTAIGRHLLQRIAAAFPRMKRELPELRMILVTGPRLSTDEFRRNRRLELRPYVHNLYEHLACCDLALVQGGLIDDDGAGGHAAALPELSAAAPLRAVRARAPAPRQLRRRPLDGLRGTLDPEQLAQRALAAMHEPVRYRPVETDGAARAALRIAQVLDNRA